MKKILVVTGPTATGKTKLAVELARKFNGEIVSADSRQVYKFMDIGTGKDLDKSKVLPRRQAGKSQKSKVQFKNKKFNPNYYQLGEIRIWGLDIVGPDYSFNVSDHVKYATVVIYDIWSRNKLPIIAGGTGQYIKELLYPSPTLHIPPDEKLRERLLHCSIVQLQKKLQKVDRNKWAKMNRSDRNNPRRLVRAIEIALTSSNTGLHPVKGNISGLNSNVLIVGLTAPRKFIDKRIDQRVEERIIMGIEKEKEKLAKMGYFPDAFGYKEKTVEEWKIHEHQYARQQERYLRKFLPAFWFDTTDPAYRDKIIKAVRKWYEQSKTVACH